MAPSFQAVVAVAVLSLAHLPDVLGSCEYWGVGLCSYDGRHKRPERCKGLGRRYCDRAPEAKECPTACQANNCRRNREDNHQFHKNHFEFKWEDLVLANDYDMVFTEGKEVCVQTCWKDPWNADCNRSRRYNGNNYCVDLSCEHDDENRFVGCHKDKPWHRPTCDECNHLFPKACGDELERYVDDTRPSAEYRSFEGREPTSESDDDSSSQRKRRCDDDDSSSGASCLVGPDDAPNPEDRADFFDEEYPVLHNVEGVDYMSFNEVVFQVSGYSDGVSKSGIATAMAQISGVSPEQVQTAQVVDVPVSTRATGNGTSEVPETPEPISTVTVVIWSSNPFVVDNTLAALLDGGQMYDKMQEAGVTEFLSASMSLNILAAPVDAMKAVFPDATLYAHQESPPSQSPSAGIIAVAVGCSIFAIGLLALTAVFVSKKLSAKKEETAKMNAKLNSLEGAVAPSVPASEEVSAEETK